MNASRSSQRIRLILDRSYKRLIRSTRLSSAQLSSKATAATGWDGGRGGKTELRNNLSVHRLRRVGGRSKFCSFGVCWRAFQHNDATSSSYFFARSCFAVTYDFIHYILYIIYNIYILYVRIIAKLSGFLCYYFVFEVRAPNSFLGPHLPQISLGELTALPQTL